jgi:hypothetical protein
MELGYFRNSEPGHGWTASFSHLEQRGIWPFRWCVNVYEFQLNEEHPLTWVDNRGGEWQPDRHRYKIDGGTIPPPVRWLKAYNPMAYPRAYAFHDSSWDETTDTPDQYGRARHGLWYRGPRDVDFRFRDMTRNETNLMLQDMIRAEGADDGQGRTVYLAVEYLGRRW